MICLNLKVLANCNAFRVGSLENHITDVPTAGPGKGVNAKMLGARPHVERLNHFNNTSV